MKDYFSLLFLYVAHEEIKNAKILCDHYKNKFTGESFHPRHNEIKNLRKTLPGFGFADYIICEDCKGTDKIQEDFLITCSAESSIDYMNNSYTKKMEKFKRD